MMRGKTRIYLVGGGIALAGLLGLAGCGGIGQWGAERAAWRGEAEAECLKSGAVKLDAGVVQMSPIEGPGMCGADFPLKVSALGEGGVAMSYADQIRPPGTIPSGSMPRWPANNSYNPPPPQPQYSAPPQQYTPPQQYGADAPVQYGAPPRSLDVQARDLAAPSSPRSYSRNPAEPMRITPPGVDDYAPPPQDYRRAPDYPRTEAPRTQPAYNSSPRYMPPPSQADEAEEAADDIPDDAILPQQQQRVPRQQQRAAQPQQQQRYEPPKLGPSRPMPVTQVKAAVSPPATLACPIVSALDKWVSESVQPAALRWFNQPVVEIKQISSYSCRGMVGGHGVSEHSYGNALDIAGFILADGRKVMVKTGWNGAPEESGFLHDVQGAACSVFTTVLAPGYNVYHYDHIHVDLMRRASGRTPCRPTPIAGEVAAAKQAQKSKYAHRNDRLTTGSIGGKSGKKPKIAVPGEDGEFEDDE